MIARAEILPSGIQINYMTLRRIVVAGIVVIVLSVIGLSIYTQLRPGGSAQPSSHGGREGHLGKLQQQLETITITLTQDGFTPASATHATGRFLLSINNQSGSGQLILQLIRGNGDHVLEIGVPNGQQVFTQELDLAAGSYTLKEMNHPAWTFHLDVQ
jgi:hypothetical protein